MGQFPCVQRGPTLLSTFLALAAARGHKAVNIAVTPHWAGLAGLGWLGWAVCSSI